MRALLLPKLRAPLPAILICRMKKNQNRKPMNKSGSTLPEDREHHRAGLFLVEILVVVQQRADFRIGPEIFAWNWRVSFLSSLPGT